MGEIDVRVDDLRCLYDDARERMLKKTDALEIDLTETFYNSIKGKILSNELVVIALRGEVRTGKSTVELKIFYEMNKFIHKRKLNTTILENLGQFIFADQTEFLRFIDSEYRNVCICIDEFNAMAQTGLNATTEEKLFEHYSDVFAGQKIHRITASPDVITDKNTTYILDIIGKDEKEKIVRCALSYRDIITKNIMCIGRVDIYVGDIIKNWEESGCKDIVELYGAKNIEEREFVESWKKKDFYIAYQIKKFMRHDLLKKHGVRDIRDLEYAKIILDVLEELEDFSKIKKVTSEIVDIIVDDVLKRERRIYSLLTINEIGKKCRGILNFHHSIHLQHNELKKDKLLPVERVVIQKNIQKFEDLLESIYKQQRSYRDLYNQWVHIK